MNSITILSSTFSEKRWKSSKKAKIEGKLDLYDSEK